MRYASLLCGFVLLIATPVFAQKMSPIVVDTGKPTPTVVKTGEPFTVTYRARYTNIVLIIEEQMQLKSISLLEKNEKSGENVVVGNAEVIKLDIGKNVFERGINTQDFTYTFRVINDKKGVYSLASFDFVWVKKKAGTTTTQAQEKEELNKLPTDEVGISYVTSVVKPPPLDIRDGFKFESFGGTIRKLVVYAYTVIGLCSFGVLFVLYRFTRKPKAKKAEADAKEQKSAVELAEEESKNLSPKQARKNLLRELRKLSKDEEIKKEPLKLEAELRRLIRSFLIATLPEGPVRVYASDTDHEIFTRFDKLDDKQEKQFGRRRCDVFYGLATRIEEYQESIDSGSTQFSRDPQEEIQDIAILVKCLTWQGRLMLRFKQRKSE